MHYDLFLSCASFQLFMLAKCVTTRENYVNKNIKICPRETHRRCIAIGSENESEHFKVHYL